MQTAISYCQQNIYEYLKSEGMQVGLTYISNACCNNPAVFEEILTQIQPIDHKYQNAFLGTPISLRYCDETDMYSRIAKSVGNCMIPHRCMDLFPRPSILLEVACRRGNMHVVNYLLQLESIYVKVDYVQAAMQCLNLHVLKALLKRFNETEDGQENVPTSILMSFIAECDVLDYEHELQRLRATEILRWILETPQIPISEALIIYAAFLGDELSFINLLSDARIHDYSMSNIWIIDCSHQDFCPRMLDMAAKSILMLLEKDIIHQDRIIRFEKVIYTCALSCIKQSAWFIRENHAAVFGSRMMTEVLKQVTRQNIDNIFPILKITTTEQVDLLMELVKDTPLQTRVPNKVKENPTLLEHMMYIMYEKNTEVVETFTAIQRHMLKHKRKIDEVFGVKCSECDRKFGAYSSLKKHKLTCKQ